MVISKVEKLEPEEHTDPSKWDNAIAEITEMLNTLSDNSVLFRMLQQKPLVSGKGFTGMQHCELKGFTGMQHCELCLASLLCLSCTRGSLTDKNLKLVLLKLQVSYIVLFI